MHLADWIVAAIAGPLLVLFGTAAGLAVIRTRTNAQRIGVLESDMKELQDCCAKIPIIDERCQVRCRTDQERADRNDKAHERIEATMGEDKREWKLALTELKDDLIREFHESNGGGK